MTEIIIKAYDVVDELTKTADFQEMKHLNQVIDQLYPNEIKAFEEAKIKYDEVMSTGGSYHPDFKSVSKELSVAKSNLYEQKEVANYIALEKQFELELNRFVQEFSSLISEHIPTPNPFGIIKKGGSCHVG